MSPLYWQSSFYLQIFFFLIFMIHTSTAILPSLQSLQVPLSEGNIAMADPLLITPEVPPSLIFHRFPPQPCHRPWCGTRRSSAGIGVAVPELRLPSRLPLPLVISALPPHPSSSSPPSSQPKSAPAKLDLVSHKQLSDGSHVFSFGDAGEVEGNLLTEENVSSVGAEEQQADILQEASGISMEQEVESGHIVEGLDGPSELGNPNDDPNERRDGTNAVTLTVNPDVETVVQEKYSVAPTSSRDVIKIKDRKRPRSPRKRKKEKSIPANVSKHYDGIEIISSGVSILNSEDGSTLVNSMVSGKEKIVVSGKSDNKESEITAESSSSKLHSQTCDHSQVTEKAIESETSFNLYSEIQDYTEVNKSDSESETGSKSSSSELHTESHDIQEITQEKIGIKVVQVSSTGHGDNLDAFKNSMTNVDVEEKSFVEPTTTATIRQSEPMSIAAATHSSETSVSDRTDVDGENEASTMKEEITVTDTINDVVQVSAPNFTELKSIETVSGRYLSRHKIATRGFFLDSGVAVLQHPSEALAGRQDAYFVAHEKWLGVADGVSQWSFEGINLGTYAEELLSNCRKIVSYIENVQITDPVEVLTRSANETKSPGSSTVLIAYFDDQGMTQALRAVNIGDSGFMVIRNGIVLQKSSPMNLKLGFPMQMLQGDDPSKLGEKYYVHLDEGDVIITATDGLFDNLYEKEIALIISTSLQQNFELQEIAELLASKAQEVGRSASARTPFADAAQAAGYPGYRGGKLDAVTVIVSQVRSR